VPITNKDNIPWKSLKEEPGALVKLEIENKGCEYFTNQSGTVKGITVYCETTQDLEYLEKSKKDVFGLFLGNVSHCQPDARIFIDKDIYHIHPKFLEIVNNDDS
jgi:hypothetical protein